MRKLAIQYAIVNGEVINKRKIIEIGAIALTQIIFIKHF